MKKIVGLVIVLLAAMSVTVSVGVRVSEAEPIKVGVIQGLSGAHAFVGVPMLKGHNFAKDEVNEAGGLLGRQVEYIVRDHKGTSAEATRVAKELILNDKVDFLTGIVSTPCGMAVSQVAKEHKVLLVEAGIMSAEHSVEAGHRYLFSLAQDDVYCGSCLAFLESKNPYKKYWAIGWDYAYTHNVFNSFEKNLKKVKPDAKIIGQSWTQMGETKFSPFITAILNSEADALILVIQGGSFPAFFKQANPYELFKKVHVITGGGMGLQEILESMGDCVPDGITVRTTYVQGYVPAAKAWEQRYLQKTGEKYVPAFAHQGYVASSVLFQAIKKAGTTNTEKVIDTLEKETFDTPMVSGITFRKFDHRSTIGEILGQTKYNPKLGYSMLTNLVYIPTENHAITEEEVNARRAKARGSK
jgi:branched-chain amino acid transport system substrate-binding protein